MLLCQKYEVLNEVQNLSAKLIRLSLFSLKVLSFYGKYLLQGPFLHDILDDIMHICFKGDHVLEN